MHPNLLRSPLRCKHWKMGLFICVLCYELFRVEFLKGRFPFIACYRRNRRPYPKSFKTLLHPPVIQPRLPFAAAGKLLAIRGRSYLHRRELKWAATGFHQPESQNALTASTSTANKCKPASRAEHSRCRMFAVCNLSEACENEVQNSIDSNSHSCRRPQPPIRELVGKRCYFIGALYSLRDCLRSVCL